MNKLTIEEYQTLAARTCPDLGSRVANLKHMRLGIFTEIGEIVDIFKKELAYKKPADMVNFKEEVGDLMWYIANQFNILTWTIGNNPAIFVPFNEEWNGVEWLEDVPHRMRDQIYGFTLVKGIMHMCLYYSIDFNEILFTNIAKLKARYPDKFSNEAALNRDLNAERKILES